MRKATNAAIMKEKNSKIILSLIHSKPISRVELARETGLTKAAVTIITDELIQKNLVSERFLESSAVGRHPIPLYLNVDSVYTIGINIARHHFSVGISNLGGHVICEEIHPISSPDIVLEKIKNILRSQLQTYQIDKSKIYGLGVVTPGPVDKKKGVILNPPNFNEWHYFDLVSALQKLVDFDIYFDNVSNATALSEKYFGVARGISNFISILVDEGVGSGIVINNDLFSGTNELGHTSIQFDGKKCACGNIGCLERYASIPSILEGTDYSDWESVTNKPDIPLIQKEADYLSTAIITANNLFNFEMVVLCSKIAYHAEPLIDFINQDISGKILSKKPLSIYTGKVFSKTLIASSVAVHRFFT